MFAGLHLPEAARDRAAGERLLALARDCSPRVEAVAGDLVALDASGLTRLFGGPRPFAEHVHRQGAEHGFPVSVAVAATRTAALLLARARPGVMVVPRGREAKALAPLPVALLARLDGKAGAPAGSARPEAMAPTAASSSRQGTRGGSSSRHYRLAPPPSSRQAAERVADGAPFTDLLATLERWGIRTLGELAALPAAGLFERLGEAGTRWHRLARGEDHQPLVRETIEPRFEQALELDWPIEGLEPLSFVLARLLEPLGADLERHDRGAVVLHVWLKLVTRTVHHRALHLPAPIRDPRVLRTLVLLDLESHPPQAGIDQVRLAAEPAPGRVVQHSLLVRPLPSPDQLCTLMARLTALMGKGRCGSPLPVDTHRPGAVALAPFAPDDMKKGVAKHGVAYPFQTSGAEQVRDPSFHPARYDERLIRPAFAPASVLRRFRQPVPARVAVETGRPVRVAARLAGIAGSAVQQRAGPWHTSGGWWAEPWDREEWDVALADRAVYRVHRDRATGQWFVEGVWD